MSPSIRLGISACLLGEKVRYDGRAKTDLFLKENLGRYVRYIPICPEAESGLGVPREPMQLHSTARGVLIVTVETGRNCTPVLLDWARRRLKTLRTQSLDGFILKGRSPSCGPAKVPLYTLSGARCGNTSGLFAALLEKRFPLLPLEEAEKLHDPSARGNFFDRVFTLRRWRDLLKRGKTAKALELFHKRHELLLKSHSRSGFERLEKLTSKSASTPKAYSRYEKILLEVLKRPATRSKHAGVMREAYKVLAEDLPAQARKHLTSTIGNYRAARLPLIVPLTLLRHYARIQGRSGLLSQWYLNPGPVELTLRTT